MKGHVQGCEAADASPEKVALNKVLYEFPALVQQSKNKTVLIDPIIDSIKTSSSHYAL